MKLKNIKYILLLYLFCLQSLQASDWYSAPPLMVPRGGAAAVAYQNHIYVFGGKSLNNNILNSVERYDLQEGVWDTSAVPAFKYPRFNATAIVFENRIYLMGGHDGKSALKVVEMYDPVHNEWQEVHGMRRDREALAGAVFNDRIYAIGGQKDTQTLVDEIEWYDLPDDNWQTAVFDLAYPRAAHYHSTINENFFMFGGYYYGPTRTAFKAVPGTGGYEWVQLDDMTQSRAYGAATQVKNEIYLIGGETITGKTSQVEVFNTLTEQYGPCYPISSPRSGICAVTVQDTIIYVLGGFETEYDDPVATVEYYYGGLISGIQDMIDIVPVNQILIEGYPNPFNNSISLKITIPASDRYSMDIYNVSGQKVFSLYAGNLTNGSQSFNWQVPPDLASGLYFLAVNSAKYSRMYKMVYVK